MTDGGSGDDPKSPPDGGANAPRAQALRSLSVKTIPEVPASKRNSNASPEAPPERDPLAIGSHPPAFELPNEQGTLVPLHAFLGGWTALAFAPLLTAIELASVLHVHRATLQAHSVTPVIVAECAVSRLQSGDAPGFDRPLLLADPTGDAHAMYGASSLELGSVCLLLMDPAGRLRRVWPRIESAAVLLVLLDALSGESST